MMKSIGIKKCDYSSFNFLLFLAINFLVYKLVSRLSGSLYLMSTTIKKISQGKIIPYFSGNVEFLDISNSFNQLLVGMRAARTSIKNKFRRVWSKN
jgi:hypothetical protein